MTELTADQLFAIIGQQAVELAIVKGQKQELTNTAESLKREIESLKLQISNHDQTEIEE